MTARFPDDLVVRVVLEYDPDNGISCAVLGERYGVSRSWVNKTLVEQQVETRVPKKKRMPRTVYTPELVAKCIAEYDPANGVNLPVLAKRYGVQTNRLGLMMKEAGAKLQRGSPGPHPAARLPEHIEREVVRLYTQEFKSYEEIAALVPVNRTTVGNILRRNRVRPRKQSWGMRNRHLPHQEIERVVELFRAEPKTTVRAAMEQLGLSHGQVYYRLGTAGMVPLRTWRKRAAIPSSG